MDTEESRTVYGQVERNKERDDDDMHGRKRPEGRSAKKK